MRHIFVYLNLLRFVVNDTFPFGAKQWFLTGGGDGVVNKFPGERGPYELYNVESFWTEKCSVQIAYFKSGDLKRRTAT